MLTVAHALTNNLGTDVKVCAAREQLRMVKEGTRKAGLAVALHTQTVFPPEAM